MLEEVDEMALFAQEVRKAEEEADRLRGGNKKGMVGKPVMIAAAPQKKVDLERKTEEGGIPPPEGEEEFVDDDGTKYSWDRKIGSWVPQVIFSNSKAKELAIFWNV